MAGEPLFRQGLILGDSETDPAMKSLVLSVRGVGSASDTAVPSEKAVASALGGLGAGDVHGPASNTSGAVALYDGTTGKYIKDGPVPGANNGLATLNSSGKLAENLDASKVTSGVFDIARIPPAALERIYDAANDAARFALTTAEVQNGDTVKVLSPEPVRLFLVVDDSQLSSEAGYQQYAAASTWDNITGKPNVVVGPVSGTDSHIVLFDGTSGALVKDSGVALAGLQMALSNAAGSDQALLSGSTLRGLAEGSGITMTEAAGVITINSTAVGSGDVVGPSGATDGYIAIYDGTTGKLIKDSTVSGSAFNGASQLVQMTVDGKLPAVDGSLLTGIAAGASNTARNNAGVTAWTSTSVAPSQAAVETALQDCAVRLADRASAYAYADNNRIVTFGGAVGGIDSNTLLCCHFDSNCVDASSYNRTPSTNGVTFNTSTKKIGTASAIMGGGTALSYAHDELFNIGSSDFTAEAWVCFPSLAPGFWDTYDLFTHMTGGNGWTFQICANSGQWQIQGDYHSGGTRLWNPYTGIMALDTNWHHLVFERYSGTFYFTLDGATLSVSNLGAVTFANITAPLTIGPVGTHTTTFLMDEARFSSNCRYQSRPFTPPTVAFTTVDNFYQLSTVKTTDLMLATGANSAIASQATGDIIIASSATALGRLAAVAAGQPLVSGGLATAPAYAGYTFSGTAAQTYTFPSASKTLAANDGSNIAVSSQATGDIIVASSATALGRVAAVAAGQPLVSGGASTAPAYAGYTFSGTAAQTYTFPAATCTLAPTVSPSFTTPVLGTPTSGTLTNCTSATKVAGDNSTNLATTAYVERQGVRGADNTATFVADDNGKLVTAYYSAGGGVDSYTKVMLHFNGANDSTVVTDSVASPHTWVCGGNAKLSNAQTKFGNASVRCNGTTGSCVTCSDASSDWDFGSGAFTIDFWVYPVVIGWALFARQIANPNNGMMTMWCGSNGNIDVLIGGTGEGNWRSTTGGTLTVNGWHHVAWTRTADGVHNIWIDGVSRLTWTNANAIPSVSCGFCVGGWQIQGNTLTNAYFDEFRISKGVARYSTTFTPAVSEYADAVQQYIKSTTKVTDLMLATGVNSAIASQATGDIIIASSATALSRLAAVAAGQPLLSCGASTAPAYAGYTFSGTAAQTYTFPSASKTLAANDGSNIAVSSQATGDIIVASSATALGRVAAVAAGQPLVSGGASTAPAYAGYTFSGTAAQTYTFPATTASLARTDAGQTFTGSNTFSSAIVSSVAQGTAPLTVTSNTVVANLTAANANAVKFEITWTSHGLGTGAMLKPVARVGSTYALAQANTAAGSEVIGFAVYGTDANTLTIQQSGKITSTSHGYTGPAIFLSGDTAGALTETAPTTAGHFLKPIAKVIDANTLEIVDYPATEIAAAGTYSTTFTSADARISAGVITITHGLNQKPLFLAMMDGSANPVDVSGLPVYTGLNTFTMDLSNFTITGTWSLVVSKGAGASVASAGMWELVSRQTVAGSGVRSIDFTSLNGNTAGRYYLRFFIINRYAGVNQLKLYLGNGSFDQTDSNYVAHYLYGSTAAYSGNETIPDIGNISAASTNASGAFEIIATTGNNRIWQGLATFFTATTAPDVAQLTGMWKNSADNIDRLQIYNAGSSTGIGVGSWAELWKLAQ